MTDTVLDRLITRLTEALDHNPNAQVEPVALLWPDESRQWQAIVGRVQARLPLVSLGDYDPAQNQGPAYWVRCVVAGTLDAGLPPGTPIVYLPGVSRSALRAVDTCPPELAPLAELQYRSQWFTHRDGKDWTVRAWLANPERGMGLPIAEDAAIAAAIRLALSRLIDVPARELASESLDADYFRELVNPDPVRSILHWIDDPSGFRRRLDQAQWTAFVQQCKTHYNLNPDTAGEISAAEMLAIRHGKWLEVWKRFAEAPDRYPGIPDRLRKARPLTLFVPTDEAWPQDNESAEQTLRDALTALAHATAAHARARIASLETANHARRGWVWAALGQAPLAFVLEHLATLADLTARPLAGADVAALRLDYADWGWRVDDALLRSLGAATKPTDRAAVALAAATLVRPWLEAGAYALQAAIGPLADSGSYQPAPPVARVDGTVTVFVDGLRLDIAHRVHERLVGAGLEAGIDTHLAALPTVTATAKAALMPLPPGALVAGPDLFAASAASGGGIKATLQVLRSLMIGNAVQVLGAGEIGDPSGAAWTETGEFDHRGHDMGIRLVDHLDEDVERVVTRIRELLEAGWQRVDVVTDHGWLLVPGGMEKVELPVATTAVKKGRCARLKPGAQVSVPTLPWHWDSDVRIALAPGVTCFEASKEYEHGGVSPQECFVPRMSVRLGASAQVAGGIEITRVKWLGLRCNVEFTGASQRVLVDLRAQPGDPRTSLAEAAKETSGAGKVSLVVSDEEHEGEPAYLVIVAPEGQILAQRELVVGRNR